MPTFFTVGILFINTFLSGNNTTCLRQEVLLIELNINELNINELIIIYKLVKLIIACYCTLYNRQNGVL